jgi:hypothetical protein
LIKLFIFCSVPSTWDIREFPFDERFRELEAISQEDRDYLEDTHWQENDNQKQDWREYPSKMFFMVGSTVMLKEKFDSDNEKSHTRYSQNQTLEMVEAAFRDPIPVDDDMAIFRSHSIRLGGVLGSGTFTSMIFGIPSQASLYWQGLTFLTALSTRSRLYKNCIK